MNFLLIICDQLAARALEDPEISAHAPHIRGLLSQSATFHRATCPYPLCGPSRAAFWTGCHPHTTGVLSNSPGGSDTERAQRLPSLGKTFRAAGYTCRHVGKFHDHGTLSGFECEPLLQEEESGAPHPLNYDSLQDNHTCRRALEILRHELPPDHPWVLAVDFNNPHDICNWVGAHASTRQPDPAPPVVPRLQTEHPEWFSLLLASHGRLRQSAEWNANDFAAYRRAYAYYLQRLDRHIGNVLDTLAASSFADDTVVAFWSDHGDALGEDGLVTKHAYMNDAVLRVPLAFRIPGHPPRAITQPVSLIDVFPTLCDLAGLPLPAAVEGRSLVPALTGTAALPDLPLISIWEEPPPHDALRCRVEITAHTQTLTAPGLT